MHGGMTFVRRLARHGGSVVLPLPKVMQAVLGVERGSDCRLFMPFADVVGITRSDTGLCGPLSADARLVHWAVDQAVYELLDDRFGGYQLHDPLLCSMCRDEQAAWAYQSIMVCPPCRRELAASVSFRRCASWGEKEVRQGAPVGGAA